MDDGVIRRTQYWNPALPNTVRTGASTHAESLVDLEDYLLVQERARGTGLFTWGVAQGLQVTAVAGAAGVTVRPGVALDVFGRTVSLARGGLTVIEPTVDAQQVLDVPTVAVGDDGVMLPTAGAPATCVLTLGWREVGGTSSLANSPALLHAPWLRLLPAQDFDDDGGRIVLAELTVDGAGLVQSLSAGSRRAVGVPAGHLTLSMTQASGAGPGVVDQVPAARLAVGPAGEIVLSRIDGPVPAPLLTISSGGDAEIAGDTGIGGALTVAGTAVVEADARIGGSLGVDNALTVTGPVSVGPVTGPPEPLCTVRVEGQEVHTGGAGSGFSFADRAATTFVADPGEAGQRWLWYSEGGIARLWSGEDVVTASRTLEGGGLDVRRRMRVRQGQHDASAGIWFLQRDPNADRAFVGMADDSHIGLYGNTGAGWGLWMHTGGGSVGIGIPVSQAAGGSLHVKGLVAIKAEGGQGGFGGPFGHFPLLRGVGVDASGSVGVRATGGVWAGDFQGDVRVSGTLSKGGGGFTIDHPLDPAHRFLSHSFVESPDMLNVYTGSVTTGADGFAEVTLPDYFESLNGDLTYQLTPVGAAATAWVAREIAGGRFTVATDPGGVRVCWLVTGVRQDAWAQAHRIVPEQDKADRDVDRYLHPEVHGVAAHQRIGTGDEDGADAPGQQDGGGTP